MIEASPQERANILDIGMAAQLSIIIFAIGHYTR